MIFKNSISIIYRAPSTFWLTWYASINHTNSWWRPGNMLSRGLLLVYLCYVPDMLLVCSWYDSGTFWYIGCFTRSCEAEWEPSCNHPTLCSRQHSFPQSYCCSHQQRDPPWGKKDSMAQPIVAHCRGGFTAPATSGQIWHTSVALSCSILQLFRGAASITESNIVTAGLQFNS